MKILEVGNRGAPLLKMMQSRKIDFMRKSMKMRAHSKKNLMISSASTILYEFPSPVGKVHLDQRINKIRSNTF